MRSRSPPPKAIWPKSCKTRTSRFCRLKRDIHRAARRNRRFPASGHDFAPNLVFSPAMLKQLETPRQGWQLSAYSLSGRLLLLTIGFVMISVALLYFPSVARYHHQLLDDRINSARTRDPALHRGAGRTVLAAPQVQLLARAGVEAVILRGGGQHELFLSARSRRRSRRNIMRARPIWPNRFRDVVRCLFAPPNRTIRIDATMAPGRSILVIANEEPIRIALFNFSTRVLALSIFVSALTSLLVFISLYLILVRPMQRMTAAMIDFRNNPEDPGRILRASSRRDEIGVAERELSTLQHELYGFLQQKTRLARLDWRWRKSSTISAIYCRAHASHRTGWRRAKILLSSV